MKNWIRIGNHYINLDQIVDIITDEKRVNHNGAWQEAHMDGENYIASGRPVEPCVIFVRPISGNEYSASEEIIFFGKERELLLTWLGNVVELEVYNVNFVEVDVK